MTCRNHLVRIWVVACCLASFCSQGQLCWGAGDPSPWIVGTVLDIHLEIAREPLESLRRAPRDWVRATFKEGTNVLRDVAVHLKGATGSFRPVDDKPGLTLRFDQFVPGQTWNGLRKVHLNNSVEDPSCMSEIVGSELFRAAGVPAARADHAVVTLNGRRLGPYVLKEAFTSEFLAAHFNDASGRLFEPVPGTVEAEQFEVKLGPLPDGPGTQALEALKRATRESDMPRRWAQISAHLDVDRFVTFAAMEVLLGHRDGYCLARNNFRIYQSSVTGRAVYLPHGMDQLFGRVPDSLNPRMTGRIAVALLETDEGQRRYRAELARLAGQVFQPSALAQRVDARFARLQGVLTPGEKEPVQAACVALKRAINQRHASMISLLENVSASLVFREDVASLTEWRRVNDSTAASMAALREPSPGLHIQAGSRTAASWSSMAVLEPGSYRFEGRIRTAGVKPLPFGRTHGAALSVAGHDSLKSAGILGSTNAVDLAIEFQVSSRQRVTFGCELRASAGEAWFSLPSLRLRRYAENRAR